MNPNCSLPKKLKVKRRYFIALLCFSWNALAQTNGSISKRETVIFPEYSTIKDISWYYPEDKYRSAITTKNVVYEKLTYFSDGLKVIAYLARPVNTEAKKYPVVIFNRGSFVRNDIVFVHAPLFKMLVENGFLVIAPALRESEGGDGKDELGGKELADIMNTQTVLKELNIADIKNIFMLGESRGGMMTFQAIKEKYPMRAAATIGAITDLSTYVTDQRWEEKTLSGLWTDYTINKKEILEHRSVLSWYEKIDVPILLLHGAKDPQVDPKHALWIAEKFAASGKSFQLMIFSEGNHILSGSATVERDRQIVSWFKRYLN
jgi:dipeptidyl aminopeptidase/acylaminoacyl peptidase